MKTNEQNLRAKTAPANDEPQENPHPTKLPQTLDDLLNFVAELAQRDAAELAFSYKLTRSELRALLLQEQQELTQNRPIKCVHCGHEHLHSKGHYHDGRRRWLCLKCHRSFNDFTGTIFGYIHKINEMVKYLETDFFNGTAVATVADKLDVDPRTVFAWRHKLATALRKLLNNLPDEFISIIEFFKKISLKGSHHKPGNNYKKTTVKIKKLNGQRFVNGFASTDDGEHCSIRLMTYGTAITNKAGERFLKRCVRGEKRVVVSSMSRLLKIGAGLKRGKRRIEVGKGEEGFCHKWKSLANSRKILHIAQSWGMKFRGVATKYLNNYFATISWIATHFREPNWLKKLLQLLLSNRAAVREYTRLRDLKLE